MQINEYQDLTEKTEIYSEAAIKFIDEVVYQCENIEDTTKAERFLSLMYCTGKLNGEAGEIAEKVFKAFRDNRGVISDELAASLFKEVGDICWYAARIAGILGFKLEDIMQGNINKLMDRKERGVLSGSGDNR